MTKKLAINGGKITPRTKVIMPVHLGGHVANMDRFRALARTHKLRLVEDACHSWGSKWKGKGTGALGDAGVFSFQVPKNITSGEGGYEPDSSFLYYNTFRIRRGGLESLADQAACLMKSLFT